MAKHHLNYLSLGGLFVLGILITAACLSSGPSTYTQGSAYASAAQVQ